jgi:CheY-like chemotaxis protein
MAAARQKILILDDEHDILEIYQEILARLPSQPEIHTADNGGRALALLDSEPFSLLLVDLRMPQMDGFQVLAIVRRKFPSVRVVVVTGAEDEQFRARAYAMGVDLYLEKPKTGKEIINFVDCIESLLERDTQGGFRGVQSKTLVDIIQLECLTQSSVILKVTSAAGEGRIWILKGEIIDATTGDLLGKEAFAEMMSWKAGNFEILPGDLPRPRTIFESYEGLLMETAQAMDEADASSASHPISGVQSFSRFKGVQFALEVSASDQHQHEDWACEDAGAMASWIFQNTHALKALGDTLEAGDLTDIEGLGPQRHIAVLVGDDEFLGVGFTRSAALPHIREAMKQIEAKWAR